MRFKKDVFDVKPKKNSRSNKKKRKASGLLSRINKKQNIKTNEKPQ